MVAAATDWHRILAQVRTDRMLNHTAVIHKQAGPGLRRDDDLRPDRDERVELLRIGDVHADAAVGCVRADLGGVVGSVDPDARRVQVQGARAERVPGTGRY